MKKKKLKLMNVNEDQKLNRFDMKSIVAGSGISECSCSYNGCDVVLHQMETGWVLYTCDGTWNGSGQYGGSACGGQCP